MEEFDDWLTARRRELDKLNEDDKAWWQKTSQTSEKAKKDWHAYVAASGGDKLVGRLEDAFSSLGERYLESEQEEREKIRSVFKGLNAVLGMALSLPGTLAEKIKTGKDVKTLRLALAAASIQDGRIDVRDLIVSLDHLYQTTEKLGMDPRRHFQEIAKISNGEKSGGAMNCSMRELLGSYHKRFDAKTN